MRDAIGRYCWVVSATAGLRLFDVLLRPTQPIYKTSIQVDLNALFGIRVYY